MENFTQFNTCVPGIAPGTSAPALSLNAYDAFYASTPQAFDLKVQHLPRGDYAVVIVDALRATTSWVAMGAAGAKAIQIVVKDYAAIGSVKTPRSGDSNWLLGGEKDGKPIPGGVIGNSPTEAHPDLLAGKSIRFASTNGARAVQGAARFSEHIFLACFANIGSTCDAIVAQGYDRIVFVAGGFYGAATLEDTVVVGRMLQRLIDMGILSMHALDDEARMAVGLASAHANDVALVETLKGAQVGRLLAQIGRADDVDAVVTGKGIDADVWRKMHATVLQYCPEKKVFVPVQDRSGAYSNNALAMRSDTGGYLYVGSL